MPFRMGVPMMVLACSWRPNDSRRPSTLAMRSLLANEPVLDNLEEKYKVSLTVSDPVRASSCSTKRLICRKDAFDGVVPFIQTRPSTWDAVVGREASTLSSVVLPQPDGPIRARISPSHIVSLYIPSICSEFWGTDQPQHILRHCPQWPLVASSRGL